MEYIIVSYCPFRIAVKNIYNGSQLHQYICDIKIV